MRQGNANIMEKLRKDSQVLLNGSGKLDFFARRGIGRETVAKAGIGYRAGAFTYPCKDRNGRLKTSGYGRAVRFHTRGLAQVDLDSSKWREEHRQVNATAQKLSEDGAT